MMEKMSLEEFREIKNGLKSIIAEAEDYYEKHKDDADFDEKELETRLVNEYLAVQNRLCNRDLSDIPFEEWEGMEIIGDQDHIVDLSNTHANLDFKVTTNQRYINCRGCNVRNLESKYGLLFEEFFEPSIVSEHPEIFIPQLSKPEVRDKMSLVDLTMEDLFSLTDEEIEMLKSKDLLKAFDYKIRSAVEYLGVDRSIELYKYSKEDFHYYSELMNRFYYDSDEDRIKLINDIKTCEISEVRKIVNDGFRKIVFKRYMGLNPNNFPSEFVEENKDLFLLQDGIDEELRQRYYDRELTIDDLLNNLSLFKEIPFAQFMDYSKGFSSMFDKMVYYHGNQNAYEYVSAYPELFNYIAKSGLELQFVEFMEKNIFEVPVGSGRVSAFRRYLHDFFVKNPMITSRGQLLLYKPEFHPLNEGQQKVLDYLGLENIIRFERETGFFSHTERYYYRGLPMLEAISGYLKMRDIEDLRKEGIDLQYGQLSYEDFLNILAKLIDNMRSHNIFTDYPTYEWMEGPFRDNHPELFISKDASEDFRTAFYKNRINPTFLRFNPEIIDYLLDKNLVNTVKANIRLVMSERVNEYGDEVPVYANFIEEYAKRYGNRKLLELLVKYGTLMEDITISNLNNEIESEEQIEQAVIESIYNRIINNRVEYYYLIHNQSFVGAHPELFVNFDGLELEPNKKTDLTERFYNRQLTFQDIMVHPELIDLLKDKNLEIAFGNNHREIGYLKNISNEEFLELCRRYGNAMIGSANYMATKSFKDPNKPTFEELTSAIEEHIEKQVFQGYVDYTDELAPEFLRAAHPELFLDDDAPDDLKDFFYKKASNYIFSFHVLAVQKEWIPYLKGKAVRVAMLRSSSYKNELNEFFDSFGDEYALKLGVARCETVSEMIKARRVGLMRQWYEKTGCRFIPDFVVMQNFSIEEADKFLTSGSNWSSLMRIKEFADNPEGRDAMLKLAYSFGTFDGDTRGYKQLLDLLTALPRKIDGEKSYIIERIDKEINLYSQRGVFFENKSVLKSDGTSELEYPELTPEQMEEAYNKMIAYTKGNGFYDTLDTKTLVDLLEALKKEKVGIDFRKPIFAQLYTMRKDGTYTLTINEQSCPRTASVVRNILGRFRELNILTPGKAHQLFGGFGLIYDPDFREFVLRNMNRILNDPDASLYLQSIQKQFQDIKTVNANRVLTWELAVSYVQTNKYTDIQAGNERVAEISSIAGYTQQDFETLQRIYNYGKQRVYSSIPRIDKVSGQYHYEILRLDDPLAMAIGTLSDCCQELNNCAEVCMEHSMVDKNGRVFVIRDELGNIVAQSWVWRNKDVLCFDNIEIPGKAFTRAERERRELGRKGFTDEIYAIYKRAAHELIEADELIYRTLLEEGRITQEQYDGLRLGKVTVGLGYNDIAESLRKNAPVDKGNIARPLPFNEPVRLSRGIYTNDSTTQYILEEREDRKEIYDETPSVHSDEVIVYNDETFTNSMLLTLEKLEIITKGGRRNTTINDFSENEHILKELAYNYGLNANRTRIVMNPNLAIIYEEYDDCIRIGDVLYNTITYDANKEINIENAVLLQMRIMLDHIKGDKEIEYTSYVSEEQIKFVNKCLGLDSEIDKERGVGSAR